MLDTGEEAGRALRLLADKYEQYRRQPPGYPVLGIDVREWRGWDGLEWPRLRGAGLRRTVRPSAVRNITLFPSA